jgi:signal peptidase I
MSRHGKERSAHPLRENIEVAIFAVVMAMGLKVFAVEAYQIPTGSMQPVLMGTTLLDPLTRRESGGLHDRVLVDKVSYWFREPERWEVIVFRYPLVTHVNYVKRMVGMPDEQLLIQNGDLFARPLSSDEDFKILRKPWRVQQNLWKRVLPPPNTDAAAWIGWNQTGALRRAEPGGILLEGAAQVAFETRIKDEPEHGYPDAIAYRVPTMNARSAHTVADLRYAFDVVPRGPKSPLSAVFEFGAQVATLTVEPGGAISVDTPGFRTTQPLALAEGEPLACDVAFWDHTLRVVIESAGATVVAWTVNLEIESKPAPRNGMRFATDAGGWEIGPVTAWRDIHYLPPGQSAAPVFDIPPGHYFMLGDNTHSSLDSRGWQAEVIRFDPPRNGVAELRGDRMSNGPDPTFNNPRSNQSGETMTFRDQHGGLHTLSMEQFRTVGSDLLEPAPLVPREYVLGRALAVFLPIRPFSPVNRFGLVR